MVDDAPAERVKCVSTRVEITVLIPSPDPGRCFQHLVGVVIFPACRRLIEPIEPSRMRKTSS